MTGKPKHTQKQPPAAMAWKQPKADMLIFFLSRKGERLDLSGDTDQARDCGGFVMTMLFLTDDGFPFSGRRKMFDGPFRARDMELYTADWQTWAVLTRDELTEARRIRDGQKAKQAAGSGEEKPETPAGEDGS